jgi:hypothetical protein
MLTFSTLVILHRADGTVQPQSSHREQAAGGALMQEIVAGIVCDSVAFIILGLPVELEPLFGPTLVPGRGRQATTCQRAPNRWGITPENVEKCPNTEFVGSQKNVWAGCHFPSFFRVLPVQSLQAPKFSPERTNFVRTPGTRQTHLSIWEKICPDVFGQLRGRVSNTQRDRLERYRLGMKKCT